MPFWRGAVPRALGDRLAPAVPHFDILRLVIRYSAVCCASSSGPASRPVTATRPGPESARVIRARLRRCRGTPQTGSLAAPAPPCIRTRLTRVFPGACGATRSASHSHRRGCDGWTGVLRGGPRRGLRARRRRDMARQERIPDRIGRRTPDLRLEPAPTRCHPEPQIDECRTAEHRSASGRCRWPLRHSKIDIRQSAVFPNCAAPPPNRPTAHPPTAPPSHRPTARPPHRPNRPTAQPPQPPNRPTVQPSNRPTVRPPNRRTALPLRRGTC